MTYEAWRISFQDSEQAARAAFNMATQHLDSRGFLALELVEKDQAIESARTVLQMADEPDLESPDPDDLANLNAAISEALGLLDKAVLISASEAKPARNGMDHDYARKKLAILLRDVGNFNGDEFWREMSRLAAGATGQEHAEGLQCELKRAREAEKAWEQSMMAMLGTDGLGAAEIAITAQQTRIKIITRNMERLLELAQAQQEWIDAVPQDTTLPAMPGYSRDCADTIVKECADEQPDEIRNHPAFEGYKGANDFIINQLNDSLRQCHKHIELLTAQLVRIRIVHHSAYASHDERLAAMQEALSARPSLTILAKRDEENSRKGFWWGFERARMQPEKSNILEQWEDVKRLRIPAQEVAQ
ncbi:hypothetical protein ACT3R7_11790 [Halomonas sp. AOP43-A1-21]